MRHIVIQIEQSPEGVYVATSQDLKGLTVEAEDQEKLFTLSRQIAAEMLELEGANDGLTFDFEIIESGT